MEDVEVHDLTSDGPLPEWLTHWRPTPQEVVMACRRDLDAIVAEAERLKAREELPTRDPREVKALVPTWLHEAAERLARAVQERSTRDTGWLADVLPDAREAEKIGNRKARRAAKARARRR